MFCNFGQPCILAQIGLVEHVDHLSSHMPYTITDATFSNIDAILSNTYNYHHKASSHPQTTPSHLSTNTKHQGRAGGLQKFVQFNWTQSKSSTGGPTFIPNNSGTSAPTSGAFVKLPSCLAGNFCHLPWTFHGQQPSRLHSLYDPFLSETLVSTTKTTFSTGVEKWSFGRRVPAPFNTQHMYAETQVVYLLCGRHPQSQSISGLCLAKLQFKSLCSCNLCLAKLQSRSLYLCPCNVL